MSYLVLARKYRPKNFSEMVGQAHVVQALSNALTTQRLHHAYLFTGTRGVGKTTISRILAKSLNCIGADGQGDITAQPCGVCQACTDIDSGRFVDYTELDAASNRGVDEIAQLLEQAVYKPVVGRFKVFMIDEVHMLTNTAFNAMLKTLEEPPEYLKFVLATTDPQKVPATVLSRCLQFNLRPMAPETILEHLGTVLGIEAVPFEAQALRLLARAARGSMRDALSLTDQAIAFGSGTLDEASVRLMLGSVDRSYVFKLLTALANGDGKTVVDTSEALRLNGLSAASTLEDMTTILQRMAVLQAVPSMMSQAIEASHKDSDSDIDPDATQTALLAQTMPADETQLLYSLCLHGRSELGLAPDDYAALTMVLLRLLAFKAPAVLSIQAAPLRAGAAAEPEKKPLTEPKPKVQARLESKPKPKPESESESESESQSERESERLLVLTRTATVPGHEAAKTAVSPPFLELKDPVAESIQARAAPELIADGAKPSTAALPLPAPTPAPRPSPGREPDTTTGDRWAAVVTELIAQDAIKSMVRELALQSELQPIQQPEIDGNSRLIWTLRIESASLNNPAALEKLQSAINAQRVGSEASDQPSVTLAIEMGAALDTPVRRNLAAAKEQQRLAHELIEGDALVQELIEKWGAKLVPGSIKTIPHAPKDSLQPI